MLQLSKGICFALLAALLLVIAPINSRFTDIAEAAPEQKDTELAKQMEQIQDNMKKLRKSVKSASDNATSLELLTKIQQATVASKAQTPARAAQVPEAERPKFVAEYRKAMASLLQELCKIETAILDGDNAKAEELFKTLKKVEDDGHEKFSNE